VHCGGYKRPSEQLVQESAVSEQDPHCGEQSNNNNKNIKISPFLAVKKEKE